MYAIRAMNRHLGAGLERHLGDDLRGLQHPFREQVQQQFAGLPRSLGRLPRPDEQRTRFLLKAGDRLMALEWGRHILLRSIDGFDLFPREAEMNQEKRDRLNEFLNRRVGIA